LAITRAQILLLKGQVHEARKALSAALEKVPAGQKPLLWKALGDFYTAQGELTDARAAFEQWARLEPDNPEPRVSLFQLAAAADADAAVARAIDALKGVGGANAYYWRSAKVEDLLRRRPRESPDAGRDAKRLDEAERLVKEIQKGDPQLPLGYLLEAQVA